MASAEPASTSEINRRYVPPSGVDPPPEADSRDRRFRREAPVGGQRFGFASDVARILLLPLLFFFSIVVLILLELRLAGGRRQASDLHADAVEHVDPFVAQYPLHPYPILAKTLELAYLLRELPSQARAAERILELAIGDGSLSRHVFPAGSRVLGADIAPNSLRFAAKMPHVRRAVVCDCLDPPFSGGAFDLLVSNNFLHHVSAKAETLAQWSQIASVLMFSENTRYWASSWARPVLLRRLGLRKAAWRAEREIEESHFQDLWTLAELDEMTAAGNRVLSRETCFGARTFFIASIFSALMRCTGPPTPLVVKRLLVGPLRRVALPLTRRIAVDLLRLDATLDRDRDVFVLYTLSSEGWVSAPGAELVCANCRVPLEGTDCSCGRSYGEADGMLFLLPDALQHIERGHDVVAAAAKPSEHL
jgi:ubiquinone/menaquinone biosynthesis C-methylase UbiE